MRRVWILLSVGSLLAACALATRRDPDAPPQEIEIVAYQWGYRPEVLKIDAGLPYRFRFRSIDVAHGFTCSELGLDVAIPPKDQGEVEVIFTPTRRGEYIARNENRGSGPGRRRMSLPIFVYE